MSPIDLRGDYSIVGKLIDYKYNFYIDTDRKYTSVVSYIHPMLDIDIYKTKLRSSNGKEIQTIEGILYENKIDDYRVYKTKMGYHIFLTNILSGWNKDLINLAKSIYCDDTYIKSQCKMFFLKSPCWRSRFTKKYKDLDISMLYQKGSICEEWKELVNFYDIQIGKI